MNAARTIDAWCNRASALERRLAVCMSEFSELAETYPDMRNMTADLKRARGDAAKERIDRVFSQAVDAQKRLCTMRAGRRRRASTRRR